MPEIKITEFLQADHFEFSASIAERGSNAAKETWNNALREAEASPLIPESDLGELRDFFRGFGAWEDEEIDNWSAEEINALAIQYISGDIREAHALCPGDGLGEINWREYQRLAEQGRLSGNMFVSGVDVYFQFDA